MRDNWGIERDRRLGFYPIEKRNTGEKQMNDSEQIKDALDSLALALTEHNHVWSDELRGKYENAIKIIEDGERPCEDPGK